PSGERFTINNQSDLVLEGLLFGEYEIKELEAFAYTITIDGNTELTEASRTTLVTITNRRRPDSVLPQTGLDPVLWPSIFGGFLILIGLITRKKKKTKIA
ncbi:MAG: LPXTG cell wall anchor domain-containing protein, partial [Ignavibacteria bacterium]|nr:LPXTG cell wall anchor domain-containing protein [Ignavibacteria bacterium]